MNQLVPIYRPDEAIRGDHTADVSLYADGFAADEVPANFVTTHSRFERESHPDGPSRGSYVEVQAELVSLFLGGGWANRDGAVAMFGEDQVAAVEEKVAEHIEAEL